MPCQFGSCSSTDRRATPPNAAALVAHEPDNATLSADRGSWSRLLRFVSEAPQCSPRGPRFRMPSGGQYRASLRVRNEAICIPPCAHHLVYRDVRIQR
jgi:hypothetical protein